MNDAHHSERQVVRLAGIGTMADPRWLERSEKRASKRIAKMEESVYAPELPRQDLEFVMKKIGLGETEFDGVMTAPARSQAVPEPGLTIPQVAARKDTFCRIATAAR